MIPPDSSGSPGKNIIVIDDDAPIRRGLVLALKKSYEVFAAPSVDEGMELMAKVRPDLVILDYNMPDKDGLVGLSMIRETNADIPVLFLTGNNEPSIQQAAMSGGATAFVLKPFSMDELFKLVEEFVAA